MGFKNRTSSTATPKRNCSKHRPARATPAQLQRLKRWGPKMIFGTGPLDGFERLAYGGIGRDGKPLPFAATTPEAAAAIVGPHNIVHIAVRVRVLNLAEAQDAADYEAGSR